MMRRARGGGGLGHRLGARRRDRAERENTIPLINVVFLLLVFFLVAGTLSAPRDTGVDLATAEGFDPAALDPRSIYVDATGALRVGGAETDVAGALARVTAAGDGDSDGALTLVPDRDLKASVLLGRLAELRQASDRPIRILTRRPSGG